MGLCFSLNVQSTAAASKAPTTSICVACLNVAEIVLYPCGHFCLCKSCGDILLRKARKNKPERLFLELDYKIKRRGISCPMCRRKGLPAIVYPNIAE